MKKSEIWRNVIAAVATADMDFDVLFEALHECFNEYETAIILERHEEAE